MSSRAVTVSVITISFRDLDGLRKTVDSVLAQRSSAAIEHIIVDGDSGSDVVDYLRSLPADSISWTSEPDAGRYDAMNTGIRRATGDIIWLMHSGDCFADPGSVEYVVNSLEHPASQWGYARVRRIAPDGSDLGVWGEVPFDFDRFSKFKFTIPHQAAFVGRDVSAEVGEYDTEFGLAADQLYLLRAALRHEPVVLDRVVCDFDTTGAGTVRPIADNFRDLRRAWDEVTYYPYGSRPRARLYSRFFEFRVRAFYSAYRVAASVRGRAAGRSGRRSGG